jgi:hypothetical protein
MTIAPPKKKFHFEIVLQFAAKNVINFFPKRTVESSIIDNFS